MPVVQGNNWLWVVVIGLIAGAILFGVLPLSEQATAREQIQLQAERERTERAIQEQQSQRHGAELRAEATARVTDYVGFIGSIAVFVVGLVLVAGAVVFGLNWFDGQQTRRTLLILEHQRQVAQLQAGERLALPVGREVVTYSQVGQNHE